MRTEQFTPGPWKVVTNIHKNGKCFCYRLDGEDTTLLQTEANSKLMEAAPDMYEALKEILDAYGVSTYSNLSMWKKGIAALSKANPQIK